jgi:tRNA threonylcarbamoyladenosine biosynthesis protein TsaB
MKLLAIDTAAQRLQLGLLRGDRIDTHIEDMAQGQAERLFPAIAGLLAGAGLAYADLTRIAVTTGPGSFTGVRIGLSAARGLGLALGIPVIGVPSLLALSLLANGPATVIVDARRGEAYLQRFEAAGVPIAPPSLVSASEARSRAAAERLIVDPFADIGRVARFAASLDPSSYPPDAGYVRGADAKPQERFAVPRAGVA